MTPGVHFPGKYLILFYKQQSLDSKFRGTPDVPASLLLDEQGNRDWRRDFRTSHNTGFESCFLFASMSRRPERPLEEVPQRINCQGCKPGSKRTVCDSRAHSPAHFPPSCLQSVTSKSSAQKTHLTTGYSPFMRVCTSRWAGSGNG